MCTLLAVISLSLLSMVTVTGSFSIPFSASLLLVLSLCCHMYKLDRELVQGLRLRLRIISRCVMSCLDLDDDDAPAQAPEPPLTPVKSRPLARHSRSRKLPPLSSCPTCQTTGQLLTCID